MGLDVGLCALEPVVAAAALARDGDSIVTSDPADLAQLVEVAGRRVDVVPAEAGPRPEVGQP